MISSVTQPACWARRGECSMFRRSQFTFGPPIGRVMDNEAVKHSMLYRMPLDGSGPSAIGVSGSPVDQFSFLESEDKHLNVLVRTDSSGDGMWAAESAAGDIALMRLPLSLFNDGSDNASSWCYHPLPKPSGYAFQN